MAEACGLLVELKPAEEIRIARRNSFPSSTLSTTNPTQTTPGLNPYLCSEKPNAALPEKNIKMEFQAIGCEFYVLLPVKFQSN